MEKIQQLSFIVILIFISGLVACSADDQSYLVEEDVSDIQSLVTSKQIAPDYDEYISLNADSSFFLFDADTTRNLNPQEFTQAYGNWNFNYQTHIYDNQFKRYYASWHGDQGWDAAYIDTTSLNQLKADIELSNEELFERWDINNDNTISEEEYRRGMFNLYDRNRSGRLEPDELRLMQQNM